MIKSNSKINIEWRIKMQKNENNIIIYQENNIYKDKELDINSTVKNFLTVQNEGNRQVKRNIDHYNLDMIIALGC